MIANDMISTLEALFWKGIPLHHADRTPPPSFSPAHQTHPPPSTPEVKDQTRTTSSLGRKATAAITTQQEETQLTNKTHATPYCAHVLSLTRTHA